MAQVTYVRPSLGTGIYSYSEASRLLCVSTAQIRGWAEGYVRWLQGSEQRGKPVLQQRPVQGLLTFYDLIELFFVREFRRTGVRLEEIRKAAAVLAEGLHTPYPFANSRLYTDGRQILREAGDQYENVARQQHVFHFVQQFFKNIDFSQELPEKWWPLGHERQIVLDPHRSFGSPIDFKSGIRTDVIYATYQAEQDVEAVAEWYEIQCERVNAAIEFEEQWCKKAA